MKYVEIKVTNYQVFEVDNDSLTLYDVKKMYDDGELPMNNPHTKFVDAKICESEEDLWLTDFAEIIS